MGSREPFRRAMRLRERKASAPMTDAKLPERFEAQSLPQDQWTHRTHVRVAFLVEGTEVD